MREAIPGTRGLILSLCLQNRTETTPRTSTTPGMSSGPPQSQASGGFSQRNPRNTQGRGPPRERPYRPNGEDHSELGKILLKIQLQQWVTPCQCNTSSHDIKGQLYWIWLENAVVYLNILTFGAAVIGTWYCHFSCILDYGHGYEDCSIIFSPHDTDSLGGEEKRRPPVPDSQQIFVGNLPHTAGEEELKVSYSEMCKCTSVPCMTH